MHVKFLSFKLLLSTFLSFGTLYTIANQDFLVKDLDNTVISLITCDPGNEIYSHFGHSALRIKNINKKVDLVVNWGLFSFSGGQFQFGYDFAKGRLKYKMGFQLMDDFIYEYKESKRGLREQILNINNEQKKNLLKKINENYKPENREYRYEFFYDNCSSRIRDIISATLGDQLKLTVSADANKYSFRDIIHQYLKNDPWLELGIDLVLGKRIDVIVDNKNLMFLPKYMEEIFDKSTIEIGNSKKQLILKRNEIIKNQPKELEKSNITKYSWIIFVLTILLLILKKEKIFDYWSIINFSTFGILGLLLIFMWIGTDHQATKYNLNLLWASPFSLLMVYFIISKKWNILSYWCIIISLALIFTTILFWFTIIQELNDFVKPIIPQLGLIYYYYFKKNKNLINLNSTKD
tara:strand:- start:130 stop:1350 length:1221 start_codon:yes stop_codon:yes gene_type:complete